MSTESSSGISLATAIDRTPRPLRVPGEASFEGTERYQVRRRLGAGNMGVVYEAFDRKAGERVALKLLRRGGARDLLRFKTEFRAIQDIDHPNLVRFFELVAHEGSWFYTMELIQGVDFLTWTRPGEVPAGPLPAPASPLADTVRAPRLRLGHPARPWNEARLRDALAQLADALSALHAAGKVHRDVKPNNVLVRPDGQVTLLDFGLVASIDEDDISTEVHAVGTAAYMAPEQAAGEPVGPAADWYSVGVMLYEALTGRRPFSGRVLQILVDKQQHMPPRPRRVCAGIPADLDELCMSLLDFDPAQRPPQPHILARLGRRGTRAATDPGASMGHSAPFVGRAREIALLAAYQQQATKRPVRVLVRGESGVGKTELVSRFLAEIDTARAPVVVLRGRCYERESVPFKAFDGVVDSLSRYMSRLPKEDAAALLPRRAGLLPRLFPVLQRVEAIARAPRDSVSGLEVHERRRQMFQVFRDLLHKVAERASLVVAIDDLQWADHDSAVLLSEITRGPDPPPLLVVATAREAGATSDVEIDAEIALGPLSDRDACNLAGRLLRQLGVDGDPVQIATESRGHPMFVQELVRYASEVDAHAGQLRLEDALMARVERLPGAARELLRVLCVAGTPVPLEAAMLAAAQERAEFQRARGTLRVASLARSSSSPGDRIETYHDRVRSAVVESLGPGVRRDLHERLALALRQTGAATSDPESMVQHLRAIGADQDAAEYARQAAQRAADALAFDQAARFYTLALRLGAGDDDQRRRLWLDLANALVSGGVGFDAARAFNEAARGADPATALECHRLAAEQLLISGHIEAGMTAMNQLLGDLGVSLPRTPRQALASVLWNRLKLRVRGLGWKERYRRDIAESELVRLEVFRTATHGLAMVDTIRGTDFQLRGLLLALRTGEPKYVGGALALEAGFYALQGAPARAVRLQNLARDVADAHPDPYLDAFLQATQGIVDYFAGRFARAAELLDDARERFRSIPGTQWETNCSRVFGLFARRFLGDYPRLEIDQDAYLRDAALRGDRYLAASVRRVCASIWLAKDQPERVGEELERAEWVPTTQGFHVQHFHELIARGEHALYTGNGPRALIALEGDFERLRSSLLTRAQSMRAQAHYLWARLALSAGTPRALKRVERVARKLKREKVAYAAVWAEILTAGVAAQRARPDLARQALARAAAGAEEQQMRVYEAAARLRLGELIGGDEGARAIAAALAQLATCGVVNPRAMAEMLVPLERS